MARPDRVRRFKLEVDGNGSLIANEDAAGGWVRWKHLSPPVVRMVETKQHAKRKAKLRKIRRDISALIDLRKADKKRHTEELETLYEVIGKLTAEAGLDET